MVVKIFYFVIAIFSVAMVFLASSDPYYSEQFKRDLSVANMQVNQIVDYEINATKISGKYEADRLNRYANKDEFLNFKASVLRQNLEHNLSSQTAIYQGDEMKFLKDVRYENNESLKFSSDELIYNQKAKIAKTTSDFVATKNHDKVIGKSLEYDIGNKQTKAQGVKAWVEQKR